MPNDTAELERILAQLREKDPEGHAKVIALIDAMVADRPSEEAGEGPLPIPCGYCDESPPLLGYDAWKTHLREVHGR